MSKPWLLLFPLSFTFLLLKNSDASCPIDLTYVQTFPWNSSTCHDPDSKQCCQTLLSLFGMGLAQHLKDTYLFQLPDSNTSSSCLSDFQTKLSSLSIQTHMVNLCFKNSTQFVVNASSCAGIITTQDWVKKVGSKTPLDSSCQGDLTGLTRCGSCADAGMKVTSQLKSLDPNATKCFYFTILYAAAIVNEFGPKDVRTAACILGLPLSSSATRQSWEQMKRGTVLKWAFGSLGALIGVLLAILLITMYRKWDKRRNKNLLHEQIVSNVKASVSVSPNAGAKWLSVSELQRATNGFSVKNLIGKGAHGVVYKGVLSDGTPVAVKQMLDLDSKGDEEFCHEVEIISKIKHRNLLSLRGCCVMSDDSKGKRRFLVYEFMPNGSLSDHLSPSLGANSNRTLLTWQKRKNIILDVAKGLAYLHYGVKPPIYHRDIKATNILLDSEMKAKVADFGLAKQGNEGQSHLTTRVAGTYGYLAPEYALYGQLTEKSDVYSFGILVLEIMSGRKVLDTSNSSVLLITDWAWMLAKSGKVEEIFDRAMRDNGPKGVMERFVLVGILCAHVMVTLRPTIADALKMLEGDIEIPKLPDRPLPVGHDMLQYSPPLFLSSVKN